MNVGNFILTKTNKGKDCVVYNQNTFSLFRQLKSSILWRCKKRGCTSMVHTDCLIKEITKVSSDHSHDDRDNHYHQNYVVCNLCKRKVKDDLNIKSTKIMRKALAEEDTEDTVHEDLQNVGKAMYRERRKELPSLPKSRSEACEQLQNQNYRTKNGEQFCYVFDDIVFKISEKTR